MKWHRGNQFREKLIADNSVEVACGGMGLSDLMQDTQICPFEGLFVFNRSKKRSEKIPQKNGMVMVPKTF